MAITFPADITPGETVTVSDGTPKPPAHHNRKLGAWKCRNYEGIVWEVKPDEISIQKFAGMVYVYSDHSPNMTIERRAA